MKKKILLCGNLALNYDDVINGQTIKTKTIYNSLIKEYGKKNISVIDTYKMTFLSRLVLGIKLLFGILLSKNIFIMPAQNSLPIYLKTIYYFKKKQSVVHYSVIGGWLPDYLLNNQKLLKYIKKVDFIYCETKGLVKKLKQDFNLKGLLVAPNYKTYQLIYNNNKIVNTKKVKCVFLARVIKEKGIEIAINTINQLENYELDIYGPVNLDYLKHLKTMFGNRIFYKGTIDYRHTINILMNYDVMLFPTFYDGECFPGTIIDAFFAGLPVIASDWKYNNEFINSSNGLLFDLRKPSGLQDALIKIIANLEYYKQGAIASAKYYSESIVFDIYKKNII